MAVHTFSTQDIKNPEHTEMVQKVKAYCFKNKLNFSQVVVEQLRKFHDEVIDGRQTKV